MCKSKKCNVCGKTKKIKNFKTPKKKTCKVCEYRWWMRVLRTMVKERRLTAVERISNRLGYMGTAFIMMSPYLLTYGLGAYTYIIGALLSIPQVWVAKQWNLVVVNLNLLLGYGIYIFNDI